MRGKSVTSRGDRRGATQARGVALLVACTLMLLVVGCGDATGSSGERIRLLITPVPTPTATLPAQPTAAPIKYTVQAGDTLFGIALTFGVTIDDIVRVNNIADPNSLSEGQVLTIPSRSAPATSTLTPGPSPTITATPLASPSPKLPPLDATPPQGPDVPVLPDTPGPAETATVAPAGPVEASPEVAAQPSPVSTGEAGSASAPNPVTTAGPAQSP